jgi:putative membrane protein insertion efficiency factor
VFARAISASLRFLALFLIRAYQVILRPLFGGQCRFHPSCSEYATEAFREHPPLRAARLTAGRLLRCQPFCQGGYDPVPIPDAKTPAPGPKAAPNGREAAAGGP